MMEHVNGKMMFDIYKEMSLQQNINSISFLDIYLRGYDPNILIAFTYYSIRDILQDVVGFRYADIKQDIRFRNKKFEDMVDLIEALTNHLVAKFSPTEIIPLSDDPYELHKEAFDALFTESLVVNDPLNAIKNCIIEYYDFLSHNDLSLYLNHNGRQYEVNELNISLINEARFIGNTNVIVQTQYFVSLLFYYWILDYANIIPQSMKIYAASINALF